VSTSSRTLWKQRLLSSLLRGALCLAIAGLFLAPALAEEEDEKPKPEAKKDDPPKPKDGESKKHDPKARTTGADPSMPTGPRTPPRGSARERMWVAPTAEDWKKPCLITFQRTWEDALAVSKETGKPILVCVSMDGEIASEHYAGKRYREPAIAELYKPYVCVIASVYRHTPRDHDEQGRRILCPRFGSVTCGEHIAIEPIMYEKFLDGRRIAPRHIMVDLDGNEIYDAYYANDTASVFKAIREGPSKVAAPKADVVRGDRPVLERVASRDILDREAVEEAYRAGDEATRRALIEAAAEHAGAEQLDLLRLALFGLDVEAGKLAKQALAKSNSTAATGLISEALQTPGDAAERDALIAALKRLGDGSSLARWLAGVHSGLAAKSSTVDPKAWAEARASGAYPAPALRDLSYDAEAEEQARAAYENPEDPQPRLEFAESTLKLALETRRTYATNPNLGKRIARHLYADARRAALEAEKLGAEGWRVSTVLGLTAYYSGDVEEGYQRAEAAMKDLPPGESSWESMALVKVFAESRWKAIKMAVRADKDWPAEWLADLHAAYSILQKHPLGTDNEVVWHYELMMWLGAHQKAVRILREGMERFRDSEALHERLRERVLKWRGGDALEATYVALLKKYDDPVRLEAFAGFASLVVGDHFRRVKKFEKADAAYVRAIAHYEKAVAAHAGHKVGADHAIAFALAARSRLAYLGNDDALALAHILGSFVRSPDSAGTRDGMGITPAETAQMLLSRLRTSKNEEGTAKLEEAMSKLDPEYLLPDRP